MIITGTPLGDIGHGVSVELRYVDGELQGIEYWHPCVGAAGLPIPAVVGWIPVKPAWSEGWDVVNIDPLTLSPSLLCRVCRHHGFIRAGRWVPA
jgi:hypothetical protein